MVICGEKAYVANRFDNEVAVLDLAKGEVVSSIAIDGREAIDMALAGDKLYVACHLPEEGATSDVISANVAVISTTTDQVVKTIALVNGAGGVKGIAASPDGESVYVSHIVARYAYPTTQLDRGWINTNGFSAIDTQTDTAIPMLLDEVEEGASNPWGISVSENGKYLVVAISGTDEAMVVDISKMNAKIKAVKEGKGVVKNTDAIVDYLPFLDDCRTRVDLSGKGARAVAVDNNIAYIGQYFTGDIATINLGSLTTGTIAFVTQPENDDRRMGEILFADANLCYQKWESCLSCHPDALADGLNWDNLNDGLGNPKNTKSMLFSHRTPPVMITGARDSAELAVRKGMLFIQFNVLDELRLCAIDEYLKSLMPTDSPYLKEDGSYSEAALRGEKLFNEVGCATCHPAPLYTDLKFHKSPYLGKDGTWESRDFITPTLVEVWRSAPYSYCGMITDMKQLVKDFANRKLTDEEAADLAEFVLSIGIVNESYGVEQVLSKKDDTTLYSKIVAGATIDVITVRKQIPSVSKVSDPVITVKLCDKSGKVVEEKSFTPGAMAFNTATKLECGMKVPADFADGGYLEVTIADAQGKALASPYKLVK
jgi:DNA-binding beta-propeller fold protein YncE